MLSRMYVHVQCSADTIAAVQVCMYMTVTSSADTIAAVCSLNGMYGM